MSKYLIFIIFGILLFLLLNNTEKLNIGGPNIDDVCTIGSDCNTPVGGTCVGQCMCMETEQLVNRCMPVRYNIFTGTERVGGGAERVSGGAERVGGGATGTEREGGGSQCAVETSSKCPSDTKPGEIFRRVLWKKSGVKKTWEERCFILFTDRIEYYKKSTIKRTIMYNSIISSDILPEGIYQYLNIVLDTGRTHKLWAGEFPYMGLGTIIPRDDELVEFQQNLISIFKSNYDICPDKKDGEIYRVVLYKIEGDDWTKVCVILFRNKIEYYINNSLDTINYDSIRDLVINVEGDYNILSIIKINGEVYKLWGGYYIWKDKIEELEKIQKFKNKIEEIRNIEQLFTEATDIDESTKNNIIQYYDIYKICVSNVVKNLPEQELNERISNQISEKENCTYISSETINNYNLVKNPFLLNISINSENIHILNLIPGRAQTTQVFYGDAIIIVNALLTNRINKLVIVGHSMGAGLLLLIIIFMMENIDGLYIREKINSITCITSGLGLCDSYVIDKFQEYVERSNGYIEYYDIMNMRGLPNYHSCWMNYFLDEFFLYVLVKSYYTIDRDIRSIPVMYELTKPYILEERGGIDFDIIDLEYMSRNIVLAKNAFDQDDLMQHDFPVGYKDYSETIEQNLEPYFNACTIESRTLYNCSGLLSLFHKHMSFNTYAILPVPYNGFFRYNKNQLLYLILGENNYTRHSEKLSIEDTYYNSIKNTDISLCFSSNNTPVVPYSYDPDTNKPPRNTWKPDWGAHTLRSYYDRIMELQ